MAFGGPKNLQNYELKLNGDKIPQVLLHLNHFISPEEGGIQCCMANGKDVLPSELMNDKCIPICVPDDDPFYRPHGIRCLNFVRSVTTPRDDCSLGYAEQVPTSLLSYNRTYIILSIDHDAMVIFVLIF